MDSETRQRRAKSERISVRVDPQQEQLIRRAAIATGRTVTDFMLNSASLEAERVLADRRWFFATDEQWTQFNELLEAPLTSTSKLDKLAARKSPFSE